MRITSQANLIATVMMVIRVRPAAYIAGMNCRECEKISSHNVFVFRYVIEVVFLVRDCKVVNRVSMDIL